MKRNKATRCNWWDRTRSPKVSKEAFPVGTEFSSPQPCPGITPKHLFISRLSWKGEQGRLQPPTPPHPHPDPTLCLEISLKPHPRSWRKGGLRGREEGTLKERNWMKEEGELLCCRCATYSMQPAFHGWEQRRSQGSAQQWNPNLGPASIGATSKARPV